MEKLNLRELKGAPLSIILALMMAGNRTASVTYLCTATGYSDKTINSGLELLRERRIITQTGRCRYQLTGNNVQLPLYWGETMEPANPSPASEQPALFELPGEPENFSGKNSGFGISPKSGKIPELEKRVELLEKRVSALENRKNSGNDPEKFRNLVEIPAETGEFPDDEINSSSSINPDIDIKQDDDQKTVSGISPEEYREKWLESYEYFQRAQRNRKIDNCLFLSEEQKDQLIQIGADLELVDFVMTAAPTFEVAEKWLKYGLRAAKYQLCKLFGIYGKFQRNFADREDVSIFDIDYHYWNWRLHESENPKITLGTVISRIDRNFNGLAAKESWPQVCGYLE